MKWLSAKHPDALLAVLILLVAIAGYGTWQTLFPPAPRVTHNAEGSFQLGFYDLMSQRKEIYNSGIRTAHTTLFSTITSPDDSRFVFKGKFTQTLARHGKLYFTLSPIYYSTPQKGLMIDGLMDLLMHTRFWMIPLETQTQSLVVGQTGSIIIYPPR
ncbi:hypothetical protein B5M10_13010 [Pluralibacter gergoviae]|uniref:hypothetical protein n=1 Tax=Pluralibacter gergoviae TaxID=61647 RepID=UPI0005ED2F07|nr:hypothetical protein [Pluralibacter gergoviae]KJM59185.1 hypothetical protein SS31_20025 [Pluralibacter gergoviae]KMK19930.1 hypothetical protein ABW09_00335 [Pluralibacter gergoviae]OUQ99721.1 hypothetical protein B5M10_13010 [Pluralibacter gergoviae]